ncbi:sulfur carrier protein ThiS [Flavobacterium rakeshii]|uniref:Sulfur carrier protein ThiS n=1 Tax=Flavobacterium rakeshii TaxID=1038845 RepID=A0A6N8HFE1_9FLAO|nr:sulfur carrier protein ThiS [Flavobacterium rakeshii]MEE1898576.1 sulfur carrier protein ThiS [Flavobacterium rakeshii]MUV04418.1 sulfur carrier protein ThiS [Flavobacterium rakeshii]
MELLINNQKKQFAQETLTIQALLDIESPQKQKGIAVAINNTVIPKTNWDSFLLQPSHQILIISATQGG